jgi:hypothetical protein
MKTMMTACCGLDCAECPAHVVFLKDDPDLRKKTAEDWSKRFQAYFDPATLFCSGCNVAEGPHTGYCADCPLRACAMPKKIDNCGLCPEYKSCDTVKGFLTQAAELKAGLDKFAESRAG